MKMKIQVVEADGYRGGDDFRLQKDTVRLGGEDIPGINIRWRREGTIGEEEDWLFLPDHILDLIVTLHQSKSDSSADGSCPQ